MFARRAPSVNWKEAVTATRSDWAFTASSSGWVCRHSRDGSLHLIVLPGWGESDAREMGVCQVSRLGEHRGGGE
jgi:hypothetical protein